MNDAMSHKMQINPDPLRRSARRFQLGFRVALLISLLAAALLLIAFFTSPGWVGSALSRAAGVPLAAPRPWQSSALLAITLLILAIYAAIFHRAAMLCRMLVQGDPARAAIAAGRLSNWLWALFGMSLMSNTAAVLVATAHAGPGGHVLSIAFGSPQIAIAIAALIAAFLAQAFMLGAALWQDHQEIV